jgi:dihydrofolate synthase/folylpolyglutamate synthase
MIKMPHWPIPLWYKPIDLGLDRILLLLNKLGNPHLKLPPIIHVAGTNGKGSTIAFLKAIFEQAGFKVHRYTSPHLINYNERINIAGVDISNYYAYEILEECRIATEELKIPITFFEGMTAAAFLAFAREPADIVLLETGLGGRLDATNVIDQPLLSVITPISFDHMEYLGPTLATIAGEKAGIIKAGSPCVVSAQPDEAFAKIEQCAAKVNAPLFAYEYDFGVKKAESEMIYVSKSHELHLPFPGLPGDHQFINAATAIACIELIKDKFLITKDVIAQGLVSATWPARLQNLKEGNLVNLLPSNAELWIDGAHNEAGGEVLSLWVEDKVEPIYIIAGMTKGRDSKKFFQYFTNKVKHVYGVLVEAEPSSHAPEYIVNAAQAVGINASVTDSIEGAIAKIISVATPPYKILICGSLYLAGMALEKNYNKLTSK